MAQNSKRRLGFLFSSAILLFFFSNSAQASKARIEYLEGQVQILQGPRFFDAKQGYELEKGQVVQTGADGLAIVSLPFEGKVKINPSSLVFVEDLKNTIELELRSGAAFLSLPPAHAKRRRMQIRTPTAVLGVRGTEFFVSHGKIRDGFSDVWMCVRQGEVEVEHSIAKEKVRVKSGQGVLVTAQPGQVEGTAISPPRSYQWTKNLNWNLDPEKGKLGGEISFGSSYEKDLLDHDYD